MLKLFVLSHRVGESGAYISHPRDPFEKKKTVMNVKDAFWVSLNCRVFVLVYNCNYIRNVMFQSLSYSLWNDMLAISSNGGYVSAYAAKHLSMLTYKTPDFEKVRYLISNFKINFVHDVFLFTVNLS